MDKVPYLSLYRRQRPMTFAEMTGQEHITRTLSNALRRDNLAHAYLFCGPRGTGKTTAAKILSRAMNCEKYPVAEPCGQCVTCKNILAGVSIDVIEMDAASNRGIDEIRELRERTRFASGECRYKVYIIDEAHMLTPEACNAFLKTLEEPPQNVVFILATTDPSRLPSTIVSRCQRFDFHLLSLEQIKTRLLQILELEKWKAEDDALILISRLADGSLRDALGILEQSAAYGEERITADHVRAVTGSTRVETIRTLVESLVNDNLDTGLESLENIVYSGRDLQLLIRDLIFVFSRMLLADEKEDKKTVVSMYGFEDIIHVNKKRLSRQSILDVIEMLHMVGGELRHAHFPQYILEVALIRLIRLLHGRVEQVSSRDKMESTKLSEEPPVSSSDTDLGKIPEVAYISNENSTEKTATPDLTENLNKLREAWPEIVHQLKRKQKSTAAWLEPAEIEDFKGHLISLSYKPEYAIHRERIMGDAHRKLVEDALSAFCRKSVHIKAILTEETENTAEKDISEKISDRKVSEAVKKSTSAEDAVKLFGGELIDSD
ncbi:MAG: DNA polymerase III subunit gamma/tau [Bacillota bacterium]|nr:DNA polymerase III subunit gamma/tau [Bacillota bacterium]